MNRTRPWSWSDYRKHVEAECKGCLFSQRKWCRWIDPVVFWGLLLLTILLQVVSFFLKKAYKAVYAQYSSDVLDHRQKRKKESPVHSSIKEAWCENTKYIYIHSSAEKDPAFKVLWASEWNIQAAATTKTLSPVS